MAFFHGIRLKNFRIFKEEQNFTFAPITVLTGTNSSGKSTISHSLRFIGKIFESGIIVSSESNEPRHAIRSHLFHKIRYNDIDKRVMEFKNFLNKHSESDIIEISLPFIMEDYPNPTEVKLTYQCEPGTISTGQLKNLEVVDKKLEQALFSIMERDKKILVKVNYALFYDMIKTEKQVLDKINQALKPYLEKKNLGIVDEEERARILQEVKSIHGDIDITIGVSEDGKLVVELPFDFITTGIENDYYLSSKSIKKEFRTFNQLLFENTKPESIINIDSIEVVSIDKILDQLSGEKEDINDYLNKIILDYLSNIEFHIGRIEKDGSISHDVMTCDDYILPMYEISNALSTKEIILDSDSLVVQNEYLDPRTEISKNVLSDFGTQFFKRYIIGRINWSLSKIVSPYFFENTQNQFNSRVLNVYDNQQLVGELISYSNASSKFQLFVVKWLGEFGLGSGIHVNVLENSISINIKNDEGEFNLLDEGFGTSRIVPLLLKIFSTAASIHTWEDNIMDSITMVIEEPELGLHPKLQSLLADMFIDAYRQFNMQFIIETHSEYMIRRLQVLTAKKEITPEDTQLYYFHHPRNIPEGEEQCYPINISEDGALSKNFGPGFFDESSNLNVALYRFSKENKN